MVRQPRTGAICETNASCVAVQQGPGTPKEAAGYQPTCQLSMPTSCGPTVLTEQPMHKHISDAGSIPSTRRSHPLRPADRGIPPPPNPFPRATAHGRGLQAHLSSRALFKSLSTGPQLRTQVARVCRQRRHAKCAPISAPRSFTHAGGGGTSAPWCRTCLSVYGCFAMGILTRSSSDLRHPRRLGNS